MDSTPLYSAEQIVVPAELAHILKDYSKSVIRAQPSDIYEYSRQYFAGLVKTKGRISKDQLLKLKAEKDKEIKVIKDKKSTTSKDFIKVICDKLKISKEVQDSIFSQIKDHSQIEWDEFIILGATLLGEDAMSCLAVLFDVYEPVLAHAAEGQGMASPEGQGMAKEDLLAVLRILARHDPTIDDHFVHSVASAITSASLTFNEFVQIPIVRGTLRRN